MLYFSHTAFEIISKRILQVDVCVFGVGTGGTITGVGRFLKERNPNIKVRFRSKRANILI